MKITPNYFLLLFLFQFSLSGVAQESATKKIRRIRIHELYAQPGLTIEKDRTISLDDFKKLNASSSLLNADYSGFNSNYSSYLSANPSFSALIGLQFRNKDKTAYKTNPTLRIGIFAGAGVNLNTSFSNETRTPADTLVSAATGESFYLDSVKSEYVDISYRSQQLKLDVSLVLNIHPQKRWSYFYGLGCNAGFSSTSYIDFRKNESSRIDGEIFGSPLYDYSGGSGFSERIPQQTNFGFSIYAPLGINFRVGKKNGKWEHIFIYYEMRPTINITSIPNLYVITSSALQQGLGMRFNLN